MKASRTGRRALGTSSAATPENWGRKERPEKPADAKQDSPEYEKLSAEQRIAMHKAAIAEEESKLKGGMH